MKCSANPPPATIKCPQVFHPFVILIQRVKKQAFFKRFCFVTSKLQVLLGLTQEKKVLEWLKKQFKTIKKNNFFYKMWGENFLATYVV